VATDSMDAAGRRRRLAQLDRQLRTTWRPAVEPMGFALGLYRTFRRFRAGDDGTLVHILHVQVGIKSMAGRFAVNLAVHHTRYDPHPGAVSADEAVSGYPALWTRVATLAPPRRTLLDKLLRRTPAAADQWWGMSEDATAMAAALEEPLMLVRSYAPEWFATNGTEAACRAEHERVQARRTRG
jgi:hypothetical protein